MIDIKIETKTKIKDRGANNLFKQYEVLARNPYITAGIQSPQGSQIPTLKGEPYGKVPIAQYAFYNEKGTRHIPKRPFLRYTVLKKQGVFLKKSVLDMRRLSRGGKANAFLDKRAMEISKWIKSTIWTLRQPANAPSTLRKKKRLGLGSNPLIYSKSMRDSITSTVRYEKSLKDRKLRRMINKMNKDLMRLTP